MMKALVIVAHGSRRASSNDEVRELSRSVQNKVGAQYAIVNTGFLELAEPLIPDSIIQCIEQGASEVDVLPYFLSAGRHVIEDVPAEVAKAREQYPDVKINIKTHLGGMPAMVSLIQ
ncbi:cobalamin biosynthesis protein CbiX, partial [Oleiphilus sp. HI0081]